MVVPATSPSGSSTFGWTLSRAVSTAGSEDPLRKEQTSGGPKWNRTLDRRFTILIRLSVDGPTRRLLADSRCTNDKTPRWQTLYPDPHTFPTRHRDRAQHCPHRKLGAGPFILPPACLSFRSRPRRLRRPHTTRDRHWTGTE